MGLELALVKVLKDKKGYVSQYIIVNGELSPSSTINQKFVLEVELETIGDDPKIPAYYFSRPLNFEKAIEWVKNNIDEKNSTKAVGSLLEMKNDLQLYFLRC